MKVDMTIVPHEMVRKIVTCSLYDIITPYNVMMDVMIVENEFTSFFYRHFNSPVYIKHALHCCYSNGLIKRMQLVEIKDSEHDEYFLYPKHDLFINFDIENHIDDPKFRNQPLPSKTLIKIDNEFYFFKCDSKHVHVFEHIDMGYYLPTDLLPKTQIDLICTKDNVLKYFIENIEMIKGIING